MATSGNVPRKGVYLRERYPIASGIIEGSCHLVAEDRAGMRRSLAGALAMPANRSTNLSDDWNEYHTFRIIQQQNRLDPTTT